MKIWLPVVATGGGSDVSTSFLATALRNAGHEAVEYVAPHFFQFFPWPLRMVSAPADVDVIVSPSWFAHVFDRQSAPLVVVERLFTPDRAFRRYRTTRQSAFHEIFARRFVAESYRKAAAIVAMSDATRRQISNNFPSARPRLIRNAVDIEFFRPSSAPKEALENRPVRLLFVGNLIRRKGADMLAPIMAELGPGFELSYTSGLRETTRLPQWSNMHPLGRLSLSEVVEAYRRADILLFPSRLEGLPRAVMEASACGLPAVVSDASSLPETVEDGVTGRVCKTDDVASFVRAIRELAADADRLEAMGRNARRFAEKQFDLRNMVRDYTDLFHEVCGQGRPG